MGIHEVGITAGACAGAIEAAAVSCSAVGGRTEVGRRGSWGIDLVAFDGAAGGVVEAGCALLFRDGGLGVGVEGGEALEGGGGFGVLEEFGGAGGDEANGWAMGRWWVSRGGCGCLGYRSRLLLLCLRGCWAEGLILRWLDCRLVVLILVWGFGGCVDVRGWWLHALSVWVRTVIAVLLHGSLRCS